MCFFVRVACVQQSCLHLRRDIQSASIWRLASRLGVTNQRRQLAATAKLVCGVRHTGSEDRARRVLSAVTVTQLDKDSWILLIYLPLLFYRAPSEVLHTGVK